MVSGKLHAVRVRVITYPPRSGPREGPLQLPALDSDAEEVSFPHGTVSALIDRTRGLIRIFSEPSPHPEDWEAAKQLAATVAGGGWDCYGGQGVDIFDIRIVDQVMDVVA